MTAHWLPRARALAAAGHSLAEIAAYVGRSRVAVWRQLNGRKALPSRNRTHAARTVETREREKLRAAARAEAAETGEDLEAVCARWGASRQDQSLLWDLRRRAS